MFIDYQLSGVLRRKYPKEYRRLISLERWYRIYEPEVTFYLYLDWNQCNPKYQFFSLDILNCDHCVYSKSNKSFKALVQSIDNSTKKVRRCYEQLKREYKI